MHCFIVGVTLANIDSNHFRVSSLMANSEATTSDIMGELKGNKKKQWTQVLQCSCIYYILNSSQVSIFFFVVAVIRWHTLLLWQYHNYSSTSFIMGLNLSNLTCFWQFLAELSREDPLVTNLKFLMIYLNHEDHL